jgi:hypothetical protein
MEIIQKGFVFTLKVIERDTPNNGGRLCKSMRSSLFQLSSTITGLVADHTLRGSITARWKYQYPNSLKPIGGKII